MKRSEEDPEEKLDRLLGKIGDPDPEQMEQRVGSVAQSLRSLAHESREEIAAVHPIFTLPRLDWRRRSRYAAVALSIVAVALVVGWSATVWRSKEASAVKSAEESPNRSGVTPRARVEETSVMTMEDGSRVEKRAGSELSVERVSDGLRIRLRTGSIIVIAARQIPGRHLYVQTKDVTVSVVGTVFLVKADDNGSHVAVLEGAVHVKQGNVEKNLQPGEQTSSNNEKDDRAFQLETGWSREAAAYLALLRESLSQKMVARQSSPRNAPVSEKPQFEVASIRPCPQEFSAPAGMRGGGSNSLRLSPGRLEALCMTPATLIRTAFRKLDNNPAMAGDFDGGVRSWRFDATYGLVPENGTRVRGGPDWAHSEKYTIVAAAQGPLDADTLGGPMLLALLESRFRLKMHVKTEEIPVWALKVAKSGLKMKPSEGCFQVPPQARPPDEAERRRFEEARGAKPFCTRQVRPAPPNLEVKYVGTTMSQLAGMLSSMARQAPLSSLSTTLESLLVLNKTGIPDTEIFDFAFEFGADPGAWTEMQELGFVPGALTLNPLTFKDPLGQTIFDALEKLGLTLERSNGSREFIVIDEIERPSN